MKKKRFKDKCYWCGKNRCKKTHGLERTAYVVEHHVRAVGLLSGKLKLKRRHIDWEREDAKAHAYRYEAEIDKLMAVPKDQLTMEQHRLKGYFREYRKSMNDDEAWERAKKETKRVASQSRYIFPSFNKTEVRNIARYRPKKSWSHFSAPIQWKDR